VADLHHQPGRSDIEAKAFTSPFRGERNLDLTARDANAPLLPISAPELPAGWLAGFKQYPSQHTALVFSGHGLAWRRLVGMRPAEVVRALQQTTQALGHPLDLIVLDTCDMANLEFLRQIAPYARYAVASEGKLYNRGLQLDRAITEGLQPNADPAAAGRAILAHAVEQNDVPSLSLIDLAQVEPLAQAVAKLGSELAQAPRKEIRQAFRDTHQFSYGLTDLPDLLCHLPASPEVAAVEQALAKCVLDRTGSDPQTGGLTVQGPAAVSVKKYREQGGLAEWADTLKHIQTWPQAFAGWLS
ncbi:MAG: clostripain-related cysteine peptidase, partial [Candidatus Xenobia bacterium]